MITPTDQSGEPQFGYLADTEGTIESTTILCPVLTTLAPGDDHYTDAAEMLAAEEAGAEPQTRRWSDE